MSNKNSDRETITGFFRDDATGTTGFLGNKEAPEKVLSFEKDTVELPRLPEMPVADEAALKAYWRTLRAFFRTGKGGGLPVSEGQLQAYPALLAPFRGKEYMQYDFPCWVSNDEVATGEGSGFHTVRGLLQRAVETFAPEEGKARILKDNLLRLEASIRDKVRFADAAFSAAPVFREALEELEARLSVKGDEAKAFAEDLIRMKKALPQTGVLIPFSAQAPLHLLANVIQRQLAGSRQPVRAEITRLSNQLKDILAVEREKSPESHSAEHLHSALDFADTFLNFDELSSVLPSGGSEAMPEERHHRIEMILENLEQADELLFGCDAFVVLGENPAAFAGVDWKGGFPGFRIRTAGAGQLCVAASKVFDEALGKAARVFAALRIGQLEVNNQYAPEIHTEFFAHFDWRSFNEREWLACPPVLLLACAEELLEKEFDAFSKQLASGRPIKYLAVKGRPQKVGGENSLPAESLAFQRELGALAIAHRNAFVLQSSPIRPQYLNEGFARGVGAFSPSLFYLLSARPGKGIAAEPSLWASAAVEGRAFPGFAFDSLKGPKWGSRFDIQENPQPETDWPAHSLAILTAKGEEDTIELPFTFADFAALEGSFQAFFHIVPPGYWSENLIPLAEYLGLSGDEVFAKVPFIWLVNEKGQLQRAAVAWPLALACQERLDFWHYLQENAGIHSYHVEQATERLSKELQQAAEEKMAALQARHEAEVEKAREEAARNAMERLASVLLDLDVDAVAPASPAAATPQAPKLKTGTGPKAEPAKPSTPKEAAPSKPEEEKAEKTGEDDLGEAWIETPLCTSCNECIDANKNIFQYNADKQAFVANPKGGSFADIVRAAAKCPVKIIHPGAPQNPGEENLEEWVKRAEKYQG